MRRPLSLVLLFALLAPLAVAAQAPYDPADSLYRYIDVWEGRGLLTDLPRLRPYSAELLQGMLRKVISAGTAEDVEIARRYLSALEQSALHAEVTHESDFRDTAYAGSTGLGGTAFVRFFPWASLAGRLRFSLVDGNAASVQPVGERPDIDFTRDPGTISVSIAGRTYTYLMDTDSEISVGTETVSLQAGVSRASFGPFFDDGLVIGPQAPYTGNLIFNLSATPLSLYWGLFGLAEAPPDGAFQYNKFMAFHGIGYTPFPWLTLDAFETILWSRGFNPLYLIPAAVLFNAQAFSGFADNSLFGFSGTVRFPLGIQARSVLYIDDSHKMAGQAGVVWTPQSTILRRVTLDYTLILPYTYTHLGSGATGVNTSVDEYTNWGVNLGPALEPDSDRVEAHAFLTPLPWLDLDAVARLIRHGNASEGTAAQPPADGSIFDPGWTGSGFVFSSASYFDPTGWSNLRFLTQSVIDTAVQAGVKAMARLAFDWGTFTISVRYLIEVRLNEGLIAGADGVHNYVGVGLDYVY